MYNSFVLMQVFQRVGDLNDDMSAEIFAEVSQADNLMEKLAARAELQNDVVVLAGFGEIDQLDDIRVVDLSHNLHFFENIGSLEGTTSVSKMHGREVCSSAGKRQNTLTR